MRLNSSEVRVSTEHGRRLKSWRTFSECSVEVPALKTVTDALVVWTHVV